MTKMRELAQKATPDLWAEAYTAKDGKVEVVFSESYRTNAAFMNACTPARILAYEDCVEALRQIVSGDFDDLDPDDGLHRTSARTVARAALAVVDALGEP